MEASNWTSNSVRTGTRRDHRSDATNKVRHSCGIQLLWAMRNGCYLKGGFKIFTAQINTEKRKHLFQVFLGLCSVLFLFFHSKRCRTSTLPHRNPFPGDWFSVRRAAVYEIYARVPPRAEREWRQKQSDGLREPSSWRQSLGVGGARWLVGGVNFRAGSYGSGRRLGSSGEEGLQRKRSPAGAWGWASVSERQELTWGKLM